MGERLTRVYQALQALGGQDGICAQTLAEAVGIDRSNASRELNRLVSAGQARKVTGKPVRFVAVDRPTAHVGHSAPTVPADGPVSVAHAYQGAPALVPPVSAAGATTPAGLGRAPAPVPRPAAPGEPAALDRLAGSGGSLRHAITLARAAVLYPGGGLHTLILGQTGVGKSRFAEEMYRFAVQQGVLPADAPFVVFNCADYASNPQLLLSQLFGAVKGAYTGAQADRIGVVEQAAGGILFLDEIHRLPPEGQEMLFVLLDRGQLRRLGETRLRDVQVRVISATTEDPESNLLGTFLRRIPLTIQLPNLAERPAGERLDLILTCFQAESDRVGLPIEVNARVMSRLIHYAPRGNVGQLKADIQLTCARAFLSEVRSRTGVIEVDVAELPPMEATAPAGPVPPLVGPYRFTPGEGVRQGSGMADSIYERIARRVRELEAEGRSAESGARISAEIDDYFAGVTVTDPAWQQAVEHLVGAQVLGWAGEMMGLAREKLGLPIDLRARSGLAMHIASTLERIRQGQAINYPRLKELKQRYPREVAAAAAMAARLERLAGVALPADETGFLASFLLGVSGRSRGQVGLLAICHGQTASAMAQTVRELAGDGARLRALDWPLGEPLESLLQRAEAEVRALNAGQGVLLLVDMGPLVAVGELLTERTGIPTRTVDMVSTARLLEAVRKARVTDMTLDDLARLTAEAPVLGRSAGRPAAGRPAVLTLCLTGEGSARRMAAMLQHTLAESGEGGVEMITGALAGERPATDLVADLLKQRPVVAAVSTFDPGPLPVPVIQLDELLMGSGMARLRHLLAAARPAGAPAALADLPPLAPERDQLLRQMTATLARQLKAVEAEAVVPAVGRALQRVEAALSVPLSLDLFAGMAMHLACLVDEQRASGARPALGAGAGGGEAPRGAARAIGGALRELEESFGIAVPGAHLARMAQMIGG